MKLAEALQERADLNRKVQSLRDRLTSNCLVQEGETPAEDPAELLVELEESTDRLIDLMAAINRTNCATPLDGRTVTDVIAEKDGLNLKLAVLRQVIYEASQTVRRATHTEIVVRSAVNVAALQKQADGLAKRIRLLDNSLQACNWTTELLED